MTRLTSLLLDLLRRALSRPFVTGSIERLLHLINAIRHLFSKRIPPRRKDIPHTLTPARTQTNGFPVGDIICPSLQPPPGPIDSNLLHASYEHDEHYMTQSIHSPTSMSGYLPYANSPQGSRSSQDIGTLTPNERNPDAFSISSQRSGKSSSVNSLSLSQNGQSQHGLVRISSRPGSHRSSRSNLLRPSSRNSQRPNSQPMKVSRPPSPALINMAHPAGAVPLGCSRPSSPTSLRIVSPMSTATVQRWSRGTIVYVSLIRTSLP
jgi:hypothetical protein